MLQEKCPFSKNVFLNLNQKCQEQLVIWGIQPTLALTDYPSALLSNKGALT